VKSARDRAIDAIHDAMGCGYSRVTFEAMLMDPCEAGAALRKLVAAVERVIEADRKALASTRAPS
jgi:hypothetical protein